MTKKELILKLKELEIDYTNAQNLRHKQAFNNKYNGRAYWDIISDLLDEFKKK